MLYIKQKKKQDFWCSYFLFRGAYEIETRFAPYSLNLRDINILQVFYSLFNQHLKNW